MCLPPVPAAPSPLQEQLAWEGLLLAQPFCNHLAASGDQDGGGRAEGWPRGRGGVGEPVEEAGAEGREHCAGRGGGVRSLGRPSEEVGCTGLATFFKF